MIRTLLFSGCFIVWFLIGSGFDEVNNEKLGDHKGTVKGLQIYLLIGQSNMAGRAPIESRDQDTLKRVFLFTGQPPAYWELAANPLNKYSSIRKDLKLQALGPGYIFAQTVAEAFPGSNIGLVVNARGGTSINEWMPGTQYYNETVSRTRLALKYGKLKGILWHQGESDVKEWDSYPEKLSQLVAALRKDLGADKAPFIAGELSEDKPQRIPFNRMIRNVPDKIPYCAVVSVEGLSTFDSTHFDSKSQRILGERYASEILRFKK
jgi:hypothetical protein